MAPHTDRVEGRIFASHYQLVVCDAPTCFDEGSNWTPEDSSRGYAGSKRFRMIGTEADLNDHWVQLELCDRPPDFEPWERVVCVELESLTGKVHVMSVVDSEPVLSVEVKPGIYSVFVSSVNLGVDQLSLGEDGELNDEQLASRTDLERYRITVVPGAPSETGRLKDGDASHAR